MNINLMNAAKTLRDYQLKGVHVPTSPVDFVAEVGVLFVAPVIMNVVRDSAVKAVKTKMGL